MGILVCWSAGLVFFYCNTCGRNPVDVPVDRHRAVVPNVEVRGKPLIPAGMHKQEMETSSTTTQHLVTVSTELQTADGLVVACNCVSSSGLNDEWKCAHAKRNNTSRNVAPTTSIAGPNEFQPTDSNKHDDIYYTSKCKQVVVWP